MSFELLKMGQSVHPVVFRLGVSRPWALRSSFSYGQVDENYFKALYFSLYFDKFCFRLVRRFNRYSIRVMRRFKRRKKKVPSLFSRALFFSHARLSFSFSSLAAHIFLFRSAIFRFWNSLFFRSRYAFRRIQIGRISISSRRQFSLASFFRGRRRSRRRVRRPFRFFGFFPSRNPTQRMAYFYQFYRYLARFFSFLRRYVSLRILSVFSTLRPRVFVHLVRFYWFYPYLVAQRITNQLRQRYFLGRTLGPVDRFFRSPHFEAISGGLVGFSVFSSGRYSKKQMAQAYTRSFGKISYSAIFAPISYAFIPVSLRNSICSLQISIASALEKVALVDRFSFFQSFNFSSSNDFEHERRPPRPRIRRNPYAYLMRYEKNYKTFSKKRRSQVKKKSKANTAFSSKKKTK